MFVSMVFECLILCMNKLLSATDEPREDMIELIMKRMGVQKSVIQARNFTVNGIYLAICGLLFGLLMWFTLLKDAMGLGVFYLFIFLYMSENLVRQAILEVMFGKLIQMVAPILFILQITLSFVLITDVPTVSMSVLACIVSPMLNF